jgi:hypothetical protein
MKANISLGARPLFRALCVFLVTCTALLAMPRRADAQVYVSLPTTGVVSEYDEKTGEVINATFITGLTGPNELLLSREVLFIANEGGSVGTYDAKSGAAINQSFITGTSFAPIGLALSGEDLFVANGNEGTVGQYHAKTGTVINATFVTGLTSPSPCGLGVLGNSLFVADTVGNLLGKYNAKTGKSSGTGTVTYPYGIAFLGNKLFLGAKNENGDGFTIAEYNATTLKVIKADFITGLSYPWQIAVLGDKLFVVSGGAGTVGEFDAKTGKLINAAFISGLADPFGIVVKAQSK